MYFMAGCTVSVYFLLFIQQIWCRLEPLPDELSSRLSLSKCVGAASNVFFQEGEILLVSLPVHEVSKTQASAVLFDRLLFFELFTLSRLSIIIKKTTSSRKNEIYQKSVDNYVIQVRAVSELKENLKVLEGYDSWNPHAKFMIVSVTIYEDNTAAAAGIVQQLWQEKIVNGIILLPNTENTSTFDVYSWFPFADGHCGDGFDEIKITDKCSFGKFDISEDWFPPKIPLDLNGCPVRVRTVVWPPYVLRPSDKVSETKNQYRFADGLEILLMNTMAEMANFSVIYTVSDEIQDWGVIYKNGTASGAMLYLKNEEGDVAISSFAASLETHMHFDSIPYAIPESLKWCVPHAEYIPLWKNLLTVISVDTWFLLLLLYIVVSICLWKLSSFEPEEISTYKTLFGSSQNTLAVMVNMGVQHVPRASIVRIFFLLWIFFSLHLDVSYQTSLIGVFAKPKYQRQIGTFKEVVDNKLKMWFLFTTKRYFVNNDDWLSTKVLDNWRDCTDIDVCLHNTAFERDSAVVTPRLYLKFINNRYITKNREPLLYCFKDSIVTYPLEMLLRKGCPFTQYFKALIGSISAAGLMAHWEKNILEYRVQNYNLESTDNNSKKHNFVITVEHLYILFAELAVGYLLGFVILLLEMYVYKRKKSKLNSCQKLFVSKSKKL